MKTFKQNLFFNRIKKILIFTLTLFLFISCTDNTLPLKEDTETMSIEELKILSFKDANEIFSYAKSTATKQNFTSFNDHYEQALSELSALENEEEESRLLEVYKDVITLVGDTYTPLIDNPIYRTIINRERLYLSGEFVHKVFDNQHIVLTEKENINDLKKIKSLQNLDPEVFRVIQYQQISFNQNDSNSDKKLLANCGSNLTKEYFHNHKRCRRDRRIYVRAFAWYLINGFDYTPSVISEAWGERRSRTCRWRMYKTKLYTRNCSFTVNVKINGVTVDYPVNSIPDYNGQSDESSHIIYENPILNGPITWRGGAIPAIQFSQIHLEARSRGTNNNWVVLNCDL